MTCRLRVPRGLRAALPLLLAAALCAAPAARAQLLADVMTATAVAAQFDPAVHFPRGTVRAVGDGTQPLIDRVPDRERWTDWEAYAATGVARGLQAGFLHDIATGFAVAGYFQAEQSALTVGNEVRTRYVFEGDSGERLLFVIATPSEVVWLTARSR